MSEKKQQFKTIEINGCKFEVDMSTAKKVEEFRVGERIKVLKKDYSDYKIYPGVIVGFEWFEKLPTITIAYINITYSECKLEFLYYNSQSKDVEISHTSHEELLIKPADVLEALDKEVKKHQLEIEEIEQKKKFFVENFSEYFKEFKPENLKDLV